MAVIVPKPVVPQKFISFRGNKVTDLANPSHKKIKDKSYIQVHPNTEGEANWVISVGEFTINSAWRAEQSLRAWLPFRSIYLSICLSIHLYPKVKKIYIFSCSLKSEMPSNYTFQKKFN